MEIKLKDTRIKIDFSFILILCFAVFYGYEHTAKIVLFSLLHECGHLLFLLIFRVKPYRIDISFFGFGLKYKNHLSIRQEFIVLISGPLVNLILFFLLKSEINLFLFIINIMPVFPLDGGRIIKLIFPKAFRIINYVFLALLLILSLYLLFEYKLISLFLIIIYLIIFNLRSI